MGKEYQLKRAREYREKMGLNYNKNQNYGKKELNKDKKDFRNETQPNRFDKNSSNFQKKNTFKGEKVTKEMIFDKLNYSFTRDAEWFKKTVEKIDSVKDELDKKFYTPEKKAQKVDFIRKLQNKLKDYKDAQKFAEKYRGIRFFERRKLERSLTKITKQIDTFTANNKSDANYEEQLKELNLKKDAIVKDINYVKYYPKTYKYYSLFPTNDKDNPETKKKIKKMRSKIDYYVNRKGKGTNKEDSSESSEEGDDATAKTSKKSKSSKKEDNLDYEKEGKKHYKKIEDDDFFLMDDS